DFLVVNSDILSEVDYEALIHFHTRKNSDCTMALREDPNADMFGPVEIDKEGRVRRFLKTGLAGEYTKYMFTGVQVMNPNFLQNVKKGKYSDLSTEVYPQAVSESGNLFGFISKAFWIDIGKPLPLLQANSHFLSKHNTALQKEHVFHNASVLHATSDSKPSRETVFGSYVGQNVSIESRVKIENSIVMKGATIKKNSVVKNSIIAPETELGHDTIYENVMVATVNKQLKISGF
ncbi:MAG: sugar phosphate nucleotidyltransferase, partial [Nitrospinota bacterium]